MIPAADPSSLGLGVLAERGEYTALAALVEHAEMEDALGWLAAIAQDPEALRWLMALLASKFPPEGYPQQEQGQLDLYVQQLDDQLPEDLRVPEDLREEIKEFVLTPPTPPQQPWPRGEAQARVLRNLREDDPFALDLAESVLAVEGRDEEVGEAAFALLGLSRDFGRRSVVFDRTDDLSVEDRLTTLTALSAPLYEAEEDRLVELLDEALPSLAAAGVATEARSLAGMLSAERLEEILRRHAESSGSQQLLDGDSFVADLWPVKLKHLLSADMPPTLAEELVDQAAFQMTLDPLLEFGRWAYGNLDPDLLSAVLRKVAGEARSPYDPDKRAKCIRALAEFNVRTEDSDVARILADSVSPGELLALPQSLLPSAVKARRFGRTCASILAQEDADLTKDVVGWLEQLTEDTRRRALLEGIGDQAQELELDLDLDPLGPCVLGYPLATRSLCGMDGGDAALAAAQESEDPEGRVLGVVEASIHELEDGALETVAERCTWTSLTEEQYRRLIAAYSERREVLLDEAARALASLELPEAEAIPPHLFQALLGAALTHPAEELMQRLEQEPTHYLEQMLTLRGRALPEKALEIAGSLAPDDDLVKLLVSRRGTMQGLAKPFGRVLGAYARELVATASDTSLKDAPRVQALELAAQAEPSAAREAAFDLCTANSAPIRRAAADVLATTTSAPDDEPRLRELLEEETDNLTHSRLEAAIRNVRSGGVEEAIRNLWQLVDMVPDGTCTAEVLLPGDWRREEFVEWVDTARASFGGEPKGYINSLIILSDLILEVALVARYDATKDSSQSLKQHEVELVRNDDPAKPQPGDLVHRQELLQKGFPWFHHVAALRTRRSAHPKRRGTESSRAITEADVPIAEGLYRDILSGWCASMLETRRLGQQP